MGGKLQIIFWLINNKPIVIINLKKFDVRTHASLTNEIVREANRPALKFK